MKPVSEPRCPSNRCLKSFPDGPLNLLLEFQLLLRPSWPSWFEEIIRYKESNPAHLVDAVYECPHCHLVWTQPSSKRSDAGFQADPKGYHRRDPDRLDPIPPGVQMKDPSGHMVAEGSGKRPGGKR
jgi:hypothetical protein